MIEIGRHTYMGAVRDLYDGKVIIGAFCSIANGVTFIGGGEHPPVLNPEVVSTYPFFEKWGVDYPKCGTIGGIRIDNDVWIGENAIILDGVIIGDGAIIGAGAVVPENIPPYAVAVGNPAEVVKYRHEEHMIDLLRIKWWNWPDEKIREAIPYMSDITQFIQRYGRNTG